MKKYKNWKPGPHDRRGLNLKKRQEWLVIPCIKTRDGGPIERSNFQVIFDKFEELDPDEENWEIHSFNHWACGWFEIIIVKEDSLPEKAAIEFESLLETYSILDEERCCQLALDEEE